MEEYRGELFKREYLPRVKGFPQVRQLFERIKADKKQLALASSAKEDELEEYKKSRASKTKSRKRRQPTTPKIETAPGHLSRRARSIERH